MAKNDYLKKLHDDKMKYMESAKEVFEQFNYDTCLMALHEEFGFGYDRLIRLELKWQQIYAHYFDALNPDYVEADVLQEQMDRELKQICEGHQEFHPFKDRYPKIKDVKYIKSKKGWV